MWKKMLLILSVATLLTGCRATFTNLTPQQQARNPNNLYPVEVALNTHQQSLRWESLKPYVLVNGESYPMRRTLLMQNRWEGFVPVPPGANVVSYRYKFDYLYNNFGTSPRPDSVYSPEFKLRIRDQ